MEDIMLTKKQLGKFLFFLLNEIKWTVLKDTLGAKSITDSSNHTKMKQGLQRIHLSEMYQTRKHRLKNPLGYSTARAQIYQWRMWMFFIPMEGNKLLPE